MKKLLIASLTALLLAGCAQSNTHKPAQSQSNLEKKDFFGDWGCFMEYKDLNVLSIDYVKLNRDNSIKDINLVSYYVSGKPLLHYRAISEGNWVFKNNQLIYKLSTQKVIKEHSKLLQQDLADPKAIAKNNLSSIKKIDDMLFSMLNKPKGYISSIELNVSDFNNLGFKVTQDLGDKKYFGVCAEPETLKKALMKVNPNLNAIK